MSDSDRLIWGLIALFFVLLLLVAYWNENRIEAEKKRHKEVLDKATREFKEAQQRAFQSANSPEVKKIFEDIRRRQEDRDAKKYWSDKFSMVAKYGHDGSRYVIFDLETTGLDPWAHCITEIGAIRYIDDEQTEIFQVLVKLPEGKKVTRKSTEISGITSELLDREGVRLEIALESFFKFIGGDRLMSFNIDFDKSFIEVHSGKTLRNKTRCILKMARQKWKGRDSYRLIDLAAEQLPFSVEQKHRALSDIELAHELLISIAYY